MLFLEELDSIQQFLDRGFGLLLSEMRDSINDKHENIISNKDVKLFICEYFEDQVQFVNLECKNEKMMVFSAKLTIEDVIVKLRSINIVKDTAEMIRKSLKEVDFGLDNSFCDAQDLSVLEKF